MSLQASRNAYPESVEALARDIAEQPSFHTDRWKDLKAQHPAFCVFFEERLLELTKGDATAVSKAMSALVEAQAIQAGIDWSGAMHDQVPVSPDVTALDARISTELQLRQLDSSQPGS